MSEFNFMAINCHKCGHLVWTGLTAAGMPAKLDTTRLNIADEIKKLQGGVRTYQIHRTSTSFEATRRTAVRMRAVDPVVLAEHTCTSTGFTFGQVAPEYFDRQMYPSSDKGTFITTSEVPF